MLVPKKGCLNTECTLNVTFKIRYENRDNKWLYIKYSLRSFLSNLALRARGEIFALQHQVLKLFLTYKAVLRIMLIASIYGPISLHHPI